jgi:hypothetical protein
LDRHDPHASDAGALEAEAPGGGARQIDDATLGVDVRSPIVDADDHPAARLQIGHYDGSAQR